MKTKVKELNNQMDYILFENGIKLYSNHNQDCCEYHELYIRDLDIKDFEGLEFDLSNDDFFKRIPEYGIELIPISGHSIKIAGHGYNNGYYSSDLDLILELNGKVIKKYDITECQDIDG